MQITATFLFSGLIDYWSGDGRRWDDDAGCLFSHYGPKTTMRDLVDDWVSDYADTGDFEGAHFDTVREIEIRKALLAMLTDEGRAEYAANNKPCEIAAFLAECSEDHYPECNDSPVAIVLIEIDQN